MEPSLTLQESYLVRLLMNNVGDTKVIIANAPYPNTLTKLDAFIPLRLYSGWLEDGQEISATVTLNGAKALQNYRWT